MQKLNARNHKEISSSDFERLLQRLAPERNLAGEKYERLRWTLIQFFEFNSCSSAEDLADEALNRVARKLDEENVRDIDAFTWGVAKNIRQEAQNKTRKLIAISELPCQGDSLPAETDTEKEIQNQIDLKRRLGCLETCLLRLGTYDRDIFLRYYNPTENSSLERQVLADSLGLTIGALRIKIIRMRERLQKCTCRCSASMWYIPGESHLLSNRTSETDE
ncbi:MAG TPA: hypothetical protein VKZ53_08275 [Candidatus Angelobacter sp.]|nr:hypothetical protein [Candidatus Angelobacter sp.]